jgi:ribosomal protein S18 acetylase RimI-like enzyme
MKPPDRTRSSKHVIRAPQPGQLSAIVSAAADSGGFRQLELDVLEDQLERYFEHGSSDTGEFGRVRVALAASGELAGFAWIGADPITDSSWELYWLAVARRFGGAGIGRALLDEARRYAARAGGRRLVLDVSSTAYPPAVTFYERNGFKVVGRVQDYYRPGDDRLIMAAGL